MRTYPSFTRALSDSQSSFSSDDSIYSPYIKPCPWYEESFTQHPEPQAYEAYSTSFFLPDIFEDEEYEMEVIDVCTTENNKSTSRWPWTDLLDTIRLFVQGVIPKYSRPNKASPAPSD
ncbi:hypothetical protein FIBSPDRAFT_1046580 [Athelia psychrophila]|uniref:Uncharacterized protein n=1 Tax=Athelia psychrophila TaxID=1759441 RepID=A0A166GI27_9AGAM|nr:hypothetical protein FIBSPDRAFT_1046580 [Fibularhizoctonia sp. CBS 109695]